MNRRLGFRVRVALAVVSCGGMLWGSGGLACTSFGANTALASFDFCFLLNCNEGAIGGLIDFCAPVSTTSFVGGRQGATTNSFLTDCP